MQECVVRVAKYAANEIPQVKRDFVSSAIHISRDITLYQKLAAKRYKYSMYILISCIKFSTLFSKYIKLVLILCGVHLEITKNFK